MRFGNMKKPAYSQLFSLLPQASFNNRSPILSGSMKFLFLSSTVIQSIGIPFLLGEVHELVFSKDRLNLPRHVSLTKVLKRERFPPPQTCVNYR